MKVLNLYAGIGGNRKLWEDVEVTAVELDPQIAEIYQSYFPDDKVIVGDAHQYLLDHYKEFDFIWASPPCPTHSRMQMLKRGSEYKDVYPDMKLYQEIIILKHFFKGTYCVENVISYYDPLIIPHKSGNHYFWSSFNIGNYPVNKRGLIRATSIERYKDLELRYNYNLEHYNLSSRRRADLLSNCVEPGQGLYILNCARNIITKSNVNQLDIFEK